MDPNLNLSLDLTLDPTLDPTLDLYLDPNLDLDLTPDLNLDLNPNHLNLNPNTNLTVPGVTMYLQIVTTSAELKVFVLLNVMPTFITVISTIKILISRVQRIRKLRIV